MASRRDWLDAGLVVVADDGARALTIDRLMGMLGLSKGSFYHHFAGMPDYVAALAELFEAEHSTLMIDAVEQDPSVSAEQKLQRLIELVGSLYAGPGLEVGMRAWGQQDAVVGATMQRVDATRTEYLRSLGASITGTAEGADVAELLGLVFVGGQHTFPSVPSERMHRHAELVLHLLQNARST